MIEIELKREFQAYGEKGWKVFHFGNLRKFRLHTFMQYTRGYHVDHVARWHDWSASSCLWRKRHYKVVHFTLYENIPKIIDVYTIYINIHSFSHSCSYNHVGTSSILSYSKKKSWPFSVCFMSPGLSWPQPLPFPPVAWNTLMPWSEMWPQWHLQTQYLEFEYRRPWCRY